MVDDAMSVLSEMLKNLFSKPFTILYPSEKVPVPAAFRGKVNIDDERCIGCSKCSQVCPAQCIRMVENQREVQFKEKTLVRRKKPQVKLFRCIRCGLCERHCPTGAITLKPELSETGTDREVVVT
jgi:formate hydrogenlyase subunit 6/NADH:ubiquinone oxidoreductase subunit I